MSCTADQAISKRPLRVPETPPFSCSGGALTSATAKSGRYSVMVEIAITLIVGFALGYGVRAFREYRGPVASSD
jgi:hypothetical protein